MITISLVLDADDLFPDNWIYVHEPDVQVGRIQSLQQVGRNGLHRYNNSDHSMLTAMRAVDNLVDGAEHTSGR